jgi:hypothetical protein
VHDSGTRFRGTIPRHDSEARLQSTTAFRARLQGTIPEHDSRARLQGTTLPLRLLSRRKGSALFAPRLDDIEDSGPAALHCWLLISKHRQLLLPTACAECGGSRTDPPFRACVFTPAGHALLNRLRPVLRCPFFPPASAADESIRSQPRCKAVSASSSLAALWVIE